MFAMIHQWAPAAEVRLVDTVFRAPCVVDQPVFINGVVTDIDEDNNTVEIAIGMGGPISHFS